MLKTRKKTSLNVVSSGVDALSFLQSQNIAIDNVDAVKGYLKNNDGVTVHLFDMPEKVNQYFGDAALTLGVFSDPDTKEEPELYIEVETPLSPEKANENLSNLNREWLLSSGNQALMQINAVLKFV